MRRNKRCLLAYHRVRAEKIEEMCWEGRDVLEEFGDAGAATSSNNNNNKNSSTSAGGAGVNPLSPEEEEYFRQYADFLAAYKGQYTDVDLTGSLEPPRELFVDVRVLKDVGEIQTEYGYVTFYIYIYISLSLYDFLFPRSSV